MVFRAGSSSSGRARALPGRRRVPGGGHPRIAAPATDPALRDAADDPAGQARRLRHPGGGDRRRLVVSRAQAARSVRGSRCIPSGAFPRRRREHLHLPALRRRRAALPWRCVRAVRDAGDRAHDLQPRRTERCGRATRARAPTRYHVHSGEGHYRHRAMSLVDLSAPIVPSPAELPDLLRTDIEFSAHAEGAATIHAMFGVGPELLRDGEGWAVETFTRLGTHNSTHVDAPYHYNSKIGGEPAQTIDELPLEWFFAPGVVLDFHDRADDEVIDVADIEAALGTAGHDLEPLDIVLVRTGRDAFLAAPDYMARGPGVSAAATHWLYDRGVRVMGIDAWGWDRPLWMEAEEAKGERQPGIFWAAHQADLAYSQIERLANLDQLPPTGFEVACFPLRLVGGSAAPARVVAIFD